MSKLQTAAEKEIEILAAKTNDILAEVSKLASSPAVTAFLGDKAKGIVANEYAAVKAILTTPTKSNNERASQIQKIMCTPESWSNLVLSAIQIGITLNPFSKQAAVIPYGTSASLTIMVAGYKNLLFSNGIVKKIDTNAVCKNDEFKMRQPLLRETIVDNHYFTKASEDRGEYIGGYCFFVLANGEYLGDYLPKSEIEKRKKVAKTTMVWDAWELEMVEKTVMLYTMKNLPAFTSLPIFNLVNELEQSHVELEKAFTPAAKQIEAAVEMPVMELQHPNFLACRAAVQRGDWTIDKLRGKYSVSDEAATMLTKPELTEAHEHWEAAKMYVQTSKRTMEQMRETFFITQETALKLINDAI